MHDKSTEVSAAVAEIGSGDRFTPDRSLLAHMYEEIRANEFEVISLDPLITLHGVPENNPVMMRGVMDIFRDLAASINCSCEIVGHTRKPPIGFDDPANCLRHSWQRCHC